MIIALTCLIYVLIAFLLGIASALCTKFVLYLIGDPWDEKVNEKAIFSFIGRWIDEGYHKAQSSIVNPHTQKNWYMALGACYYCLNVYVSFGLSAVILSVLDLSLWLILLAMPVSHWTIKKVMD